MDRPPRILLVEDEADAREILVLGLRRRGFRVDAAADGQEALPLLDDGLDAVVTDLLMPGLDGLGLLDETARRAPRALRVVITAFGDKERILAALNHGADHLLEKPFASEALAALLRRLLAERGEEDGLGRILERRLAELGLEGRERQLVHLVLKGLPNREIAGVLGIGEQTAKNYLNALYQKLGIGSRGELFHCVFPV